MGWSCSWIAVRGKETDPVLQALGLRRPGLLELPDGSWAYDELESGWLIVFSDQSRAPSDFEETRLGEISAGCELLFSCAEEHVMYSSAACWRDGARVWSVVCEEEEGRLAVSGDLPSAYREIVEEQGEDAMFEVPLEMGARLTGFRYDEGGLRPLVSLAGTVKKPWWKVWSS